MVMNDATQSLKDSQTRLSRDVRAMVDDAEALLRHAVRDAGDGYDDARSRLERSLKTARAELEGVEHAVLDNARRAKEATNEYVHQHPWQSMGVGAGVGLLLGMLISRR
jgi:ElaB/YqjD/DUF883 family membrane-anchored ribosome-binding protein